MSERFIASDDDLPAELFSDTPLPENKHRPSDPEIEALWKYPVRKNELTKSQEIALRKDRAESAQGINTRKVFVKEAKKQQMYTWLRLMDLRQLFFSMQPRELNFCRQLLQKFERYGIRGAKWISRSQWEWLKSLAGKYLTDENIYDNKLNSCLMDNRDRVFLLAFFKAKDAFRVVANCKISESTKATSRS